MIEKRKPWFKFYVGNWRADELLRMCGLAARGLWVEMLSIMHKATPYGHLLVNGVQPDVDDLARLTGVSAKEVKAALDELERKAVFSRTDDGTIYSRKMVRDEVASLEGRENIKRRWVNRDDDSEPKSPPNRVPNREAKSTEERGQKEKPEAIASVKKLRRKPLVPIPPDLVEAPAPPPEWVAFAQSKGISDVSSTFDAFRNHHIAKASVFADWPAAWRTWCGNDRKFARQNSPSGAGTRSSPPRGASVSGAALAVAAAYRERGLRSDGFPAGEPDHGRSAAGDSFAFEGAHEASGPGIGDRGNHPVPDRDQEPAEGGGGPDADGRRLHGSVIEVPG